MCCVCVEWQAGKLTTKEALQNLGEMIQSEDKLAEHYFSAVREILDSELPASVSDDDMDASWHKETHGD